MAITQDNYVILSNLWKANYWANIDSWALGKISQISVSCWEPGREETAAVKLEQIREQHSEHELL